jgi:hypothetical protein
MFFILHSAFINRDHYLVWSREEIEAILNKSNKSNYTTSKAYRKITLFNYLKKIFEKIIVSRLSYFYQTLNLLNLNQMSERKDLSTIDAVMNLTHDIELSLRKKKSTKVCFSKCQRSIWLCLNKTRIERHEKALFITSNSQINRRIHE